MNTPLPVVLAGARGHGRWHVENIRRLQKKGLVRLVGVCELTPLTSAELHGLGTPEQSADFGALLDSTGARIAVICTPIPTHTDLALTAAQRRAMSAIAASREAASCGSAFVSARRGGWVHRR
jgi:predicted dehydrogenase